MLLFWQQACCQGQSAVSWVDNKLISSCCYANPNTTFAGFSNPTTANIQRLTSLGYLLLSNNAAMTGTIPTEMGLLTDLARFDINGCGFTGTMPEEVCDLRGDWALAKLKADCLPISTGEIPLFCPDGCCSRCCDQETGTCPKPSQ